MSSTIRGSDNFDTAGGNAVKAWCNFNGTGTVAIRASYNISSITDNGVGNYTLNFSTALVDTNYTIVASIYKIAAYTEDVYFSNSINVANFTLITYTTAGIAFDTSHISTNILR